MSTDKELPDGWTAANLSQCARRITDGTHLPPNFVDSGIPFIFVKHIVKGRLTFEDTKFISEETWHKFQDRCPIELNDLLYTAVGSYGVAVPVQTEQRFSFQRHIAHIKLYNQIDSRFLAYFLNSPFGLTQAHSVARGVAQKTVTLGDLKQFTVRLAPINEQHRIVAKIEELFSDLDAGVAALKRAKANLKRYRAAVLKAAVDGKLTEEWRAKHPAKEPASALLARILKERRQKWEADQLAKFAAAEKEPPRNWKEKYVEPTPPDTNELPDLPDSWCWATLPQLGLLDRGRSRNRPRNAPHLYGGPYPFVQTGDIRHADTYIRAYDQTYSEAGLEQSKLWPAGTLCITIAANIAETAILGFDGCFPDSVVGFIPISEEISVRFVELFFRTIQERLEAFAPATAQKNLNLEFLKQVAVCLPPASEQLQIVAEIEERLSLVRAAEASIEANSKRAARLRQSILKQAFEGKLVPQDPSDEPASVLLERLRAKQSIQEGTRKSSPTRRRRVRSVKSRQLEGKADE